MNAMQRKACEHIKATGGHSTLDQFITFHKPFGYEIWESLLNGKYAYLDVADHINLTLKGSDALLVLR